MVALSGHSVPQSPVLAAQTTLSGKVGLDIPCIAHVKWNPYKHPERTANVLWQMRAVLDRTGLSNILRHPLPMKHLFYPMATSHGLSTIEADAAYQVLLTDWWNVNTDIFHVIASFIDFDGPKPRQWH